MFFTQNITEKPTRKTPIITTQRTKHDSGHTSTSRGGVVGITYNGEGGHVKQANPLSLNIGLIVGIAAGVVLLLLILAYVLYKYKSRDEGSYKIDESKNYSYEAYTATEAKPSSGTQTNGGVVKTTCVPASKPKKKDVKEWYVWSWLFRITAGYYFVSRFDGCCSPVVTHWPRDVAATFWTSRQRRVPRCWCAQQT